MMNPLILTGFCAVALTACTPARTAREPAPRSGMLPTSGAPVHFNHGYVVVDSATYRDIASSPLLQHEFGGFEQRTTHRGDGTAYSATYIYGRETYFEFFQPGAGASGRVGASGIALGVDRSGALREVRTRLIALAGDSVRVPYGLRTRMRGADTVPWFYATALLPAPTDTASVLFVWTMEYHPEFLRRWYADIQPHDSGVSRAHARAREYRPGRHLRDITGITLALTASEGDRFLAQLAALGYRVWPDGTARRADGPGIAFTVVPAADGRAGIVALELALARPKSGQRRYAFGQRSVLTFETDWRAIWTF
jgi:hypothetical protein